MALKSKYDNKDGRLRGRKLVATRLRIWAQHPYCAMCGGLVEYPKGFELDHKQAVSLSGGNEDENLQVLCCGPGGCHEKKTAQDLGTRVAVRIGIDGFPVES